MLTEFVYTWPDGRKEVRYRRVSGDECNGMIAQVDSMRADLGNACPYSYREVPGVEEFTAQEQNQTPQAPIVRMRVENGLCVSGIMYAPGLPDGDHDLYCDPSAQSLAGQRCLSLLSDAVAAMSALLASLVPDEDDPDLSARISPAALRAFVDEHARIMREQSQLEQSQT